MGALISGMIPFGDAWWVPTVLTEAHHWHSPSTHGLGKDRNPAAVLVGVGFGPPGSFLNVAHEAPLFHGWSDWCFQGLAVAEAGGNRAVQSFMLTGFKAFLLRTNTKALVKWSATLQ